MFNFKIDFKKLVGDILPPKHRKSKLIDWLLVLTVGVKILHADFLALVDKIRFELRFNSQVMYLEYLLNLKFNGGLNTILVIDGNNAYNSYIWQEEEYQPLYVVRASEFNPTEDVYIFNPSEFKTYFDFIVMVPSALVFDKSQMISLINKYKLAGKSYTIKPY